MQPIRIHESSQYPKTRTHLARVVGCTVGVVACSLQVSPLGIVHTAHWHWPSTRTVPHLQAVLIHIVVVTVRHLHPTVVDRHNCSGHAEAHNCKIAHSPLLLAPLQLPRTRHGFAFSTSLQLGQPTPDVREKQHPRGNLLLLPVQMSSLGKCMALCRPTQKSDSQMIKKMLIGVWQSVRRTRY